MNKLDICNIRLVDLSYNFNKTRQTLLDVILQFGKRYRLFRYLLKNRV